MKLPAFLRRFFPQTSTPSLAEMPTPTWLVIGVGNPGARYAATAHNVGYMAADALGDPAKYQAIHGAPALVQELDIQGNSVVLVRSTTYMNLSGEAIAPLVAQWGIDPDHVIVLHDELDLPRGTVRVKKGGSENGHNGLKSVSEVLGTRDFLRVRIGIGRPTPPMSISDYVLAPVDFDAAAAIDRAARAASLLVSAGLSGAQNTIHAEK